MSTIYSWAAEQSADATGAAGDWTLVYDTSTGRTKKAALSSVFLGQASDRVFGFYGETGVNQGTMTATALTALTAATISAANSANVYCFSTSTAAKALVKRMSQIQVDLETLMGKIDSTGLVNVTGLA
jgi:hypothetical protein